MRWSLSSLAIVLWLMGMVTGYTLRGYVHLLPLIAIGIVFTARRRDARLHRRSAY